MAPVSWPYWPRMAQAMPPAQAVKRMQGSQYQNLFEFAIGNVEPYLILDALFEDAFGECEQRLRRWVIVVTQLPNDRYMRPVRYFFRCDRRCSGFAQ